MCLYTTHEQYQVCIYMGPISFCARRKHVLLVSKSDISEKTKKN